MYCKRICETGVVSSRRRSGTARRWGARSGVFAAALLLVVMVAADTAQAIPSDYSFGTVRNESYGSGVGAGGICVAASFINGTVYLQNAFPATYGGTPLATGNLSNAKTAMEHFAVDGWTAPGGTSYAGYYTRAASGGAVFGDWWQTMIDWTESFAPGRTAYSGQVAASLLSGESPSAWTMGGNVADQFPTYGFLNSAAGNNEFVELGIYKYAITDNELTIVSGHAVNLADIKYDNGAFTITYQDPNFPATPFYTATLGAMMIDGQLALEFNEAPTYGGNVFIAAAFTMSPDSAVPEPLTIIAIVIGIAGLGGYIRRRRMAAE